MMKKKERKKWRKAKEKNLHRGDYWRDGSQEMWIHCYKTEGYETACQLPHDSTLGLHTGAIFVLPKEDSVVFDNLAVVVSEGETHPNDSTHSGHKGTTSKGQRGRFS